MSDEQVFTMISTPWGQKCAQCDKPATGRLNLSIVMASSVPDRYEWRCADHMPKLDLHEACKAGQASQRETIDKLREALQAAQNALAAAPGGVCLDADCDIAECQGTIAAIAAAKALLEETKP